MPNLSVKLERWPIRGAFTISRGAKTEALVLVAQLDEAGFSGRGECVPYARYNESADSVVAAIEAMREPLLHGLDRAGLQQAMPPGAARNAIDCAFWDLEAKRSRHGGHTLAQIPALQPVTTAYTISLGTPSAMAEASKQASDRAVLKIKLGGAGDPERIAAVRRAAPDSALIVDANEAWSSDNVAENLAACVRAGVKLIEQPLPAGHDEALAALARTIPICADESVHDRASLAGLIGKYDAVNIKLDKTGGLTEALVMADDAERLGLDLMVGCMVATSLAMAPAMLLARQARFVDLDGPLLLARDRPDGLLYTGSQVHPASLALWG